MQDSLPSIKKEISYRQRCRTRHSINSGVASSLEVFIDGDMSKEEKDQDCQKSVPIVASTTPLAPNLSRVCGKCLGTPVSRTRKHGLEAVEQAMQRISGTIPSNLLTRRPSGRRWRVHASDYDEELARAHLFKPFLPSTHTERRRLAIYYACEQIALFKLLNWMDWHAKESRQANTLNAQTYGTSTTRTSKIPPLANWKNNMHLEVLHSTFSPEQSTIMDDVDVFQARHAAALQEKHVFFFASGCCICWGLTRDEEAQHLRMLTPFSSGKVNQVDAQQMEFGYGDRSSIARDAIILCTMNVAEKIAISFALSQSVTLGAFETRVEDRIRLTYQIPFNLASVGATQFSQEEMSKLIGQLFIELADVNIHSNILDEPEYFLKSPESDNFKVLYEKMLRYQGVAKRVAILNKRLNILRDLASVLNQQLTRHQGAKLEWIVIWMLLFQVVIAIGWEIILKDILGYFRWE